MILRQIRKTDNLIDIKFRNECKLFFFPITIIQ